MYFLVRMSSASKNNTVHSQVRLEAQLVTTRPDNVVSGGVPTLGSGRS